MRCKSSFYTGPTRARWRTIEDRVHGEVSRGTSVDADSLLARAMHTIRLSSNRSCAVSPFSQVSGYVQQVSIFGNLDGCVLSTFEYMHSTFEYTCWQTHRCVGLVRRGPRLLLHALRDLVVQHNLVLPRAHRSLPLLAGKVGVVPRTSPLHVRHLEFIVVQVTQPASFIMSGNGEELRAHSLHLLRIGRSKESNAPTFLFTTKPVRQPVSAS